MGPEHENGGHYRVGSDEMFDNQIGDDELQVEVKKLLQEGVEIKRR